MRALRLTPPPLRIRRYSKIGTFVPIFAVGEICTAGLLGYTGQALPFKVYILGSLAGQIAGLFLISILSLGVDDPYPVRCSSDAESAQQNISKTSIFRGKRRPKGSTEETCRAGQDGAGGRDANAIGTPARDGR